MSLRAARGAAVLLVFQTSLSLPSVALAQIRSQPPAGSTQTRVPEVVSVDFGERQSGAASIEVIDPCGARVDRGEASVAGDRASVDVVATASGRYVVSYAGVSAADGSPTRGRFSFRVEGVEGCAAGDEPDERRAGRGIWDLPKGDFAVALAIAAAIGALGGLVYAAILGPRA